MCVCMYACMCVFRYVCLIILSILIDCIGIVNISRSVVIIHSLLILTETNFVYKPIKCVF